MVSHQDTTNKSTFLKASNSPVLEVGSSSDDGVLRPHHQEDSNQHEYNVEEVVRDDTLGGVKDDPYDFENAMSTWHLKSWLKFINEVM
ncbi:hypothetical protein L2E82_08235 [Cichorium intybus]|uniref:Uncharacterized protein n=1 Tax=Cichorium intybus TaxID=13427 RepID=A0ACB9G718_CICIN|nr:hypothetical protein L2E82_08235 [Cichorium intybus]